MWIREVDIPKPLIEAQQNGELVLFIGAGASRGAPSSLPDFRALASLIAEEAGISFSDAQLDEPDVLLGDLKDGHDVDVHVRVASHLGNPESAPNRLHEAICALSSSKAPVRIVTTNYDRHLSTVLTAQGEEVLEYQAPALPMGDNFNGLVYLHGSLNQPPSELLVTDADFGRAYLRDAWATRFLERMFTTYKVLFIGYSHSDVVMRYLARGLGPDGRRFIMTPDPTAANWRRFFVKPIEYPNPDGSHEPLMEAVQGWAEWSAMGLLDHRQRVSTLVSSSPSAVPEEQSYMEETLRDPERVGFFVEHARGEEWLAWASSQREFKALFDPKSEGSECSMPLATWFAENFVSKEAFSGRAVALTQEMGGRIGAHLHEAIGRTIHRSPTPRPDWVTSWLILLVLNPGAFGNHWLDYALGECRWPDDCEVAVLLMDHLLEPHIQLQPGFGTDHAVRPEIKIRGDDHWLTKAWNDLFLPNLGEAFGHLLPVVERHLRRVHQLQASFGSLGPEWDPVSFTRAAIEPHEQDSLRWPVDILIDIARESLEAALSSVPEIGMGYLGSWSSADSALLRRLAVHGWSVRDDVNAAQKIEWLLERGILYNRQLRHEIFGLVADAIGDADPATADALVARALEGPSDVPDNVRDYEIFNLIAWITRNAPDLQSSAEALEQVTAQHEEFKEREHPDLLSWSSFGTSAYQPPMTTEAFHGLVATTPEEAVQQILQYEDSSPPFDSPTWNDALSLVSSTVREFPADGLEILDSDLGDKVDIVRAVVSGWSRADLDPDQANDVLTKLNGLDLSQIVQEVASLLTEASDGTKTEWHLVEQSRVVAAQVWAEIGTEGVDAEEAPFAEANWLHKAINHAAGQLSQFWLRALSSAWREAGDSWDGIPEDFRSAFATLIEGEDVKARMAQVIFASQHHFIYAADSQWCIEHVLPLLNWSVPDRARAAWDGYLTWGRWSDRTLEAGLLDLYLETVIHIAEFDDNMQKRLCEHLASVAVNSELGKGWVRDFTASTTPEVRTEWISQIAFILRDLPPAAVEHQWDSWLRVYWTDRLGSVPTAITFDESSALALWAIYLSDSIPEAVDLALGSPAGVPQHSNLLMDLKDANRIAQSPEAVARLLAHVLTGTEQPFWECHNVAEIVGLLGASLNPEQLQPIKEQGLRLGCTDAGNW